MRSVILVILSALALAGIFLGYWVSQPALVLDPHPHVNGPVATMPASVPNSTVGKSTEGWFHQYDSTGTRLTTSFRGDHFEPRSNGTIDVTNPGGRFFLNGGQYLEVTGLTGNIVMKQMPSSAKGGGLMSAAPMSPPRRGRLDYVTLKLIDEATGQATLTMHTRNIVFDNETFLISTEGYRDENGVNLAADEVPVHIVGQESGQGHGAYLKQMEGRGLNVRWNDRDGRLELLEIKHGDFLVIDNATSPTLPGNKPKSMGVQANSLSAPFAGMLASADPQAAGQLVTPSTSRAAGPPKPSARPGRATVVYRATFFDNVRINQPDPSGKFDQVVIDNVNQMDVDFLMGSGGSSTTRPATTTSATAPATTAATDAPAASAQPNIASPAADAPAVLKPVEPAPSTSSAPTIAPATQPAVASQIIIHWTGRLFMAPLMTKPWSPLRTGDGAVKLIGQPMHMHRIDPAGGGFEDIRSATALYATSGDHLQLDHSNQFPNIFIDRIPPATVKDQRQTHVVSTGNVQYLRDIQVARCVGPGFADVPMEGDEKAPPATMHATWSHLAEFVMTQGAQMALREGHFVGDVYIQHPRMMLKSGLLDLYFAPLVKDPKDKSPADETTADKAAAPSKSRDGTGSQQTLRQVVATTTVFCQFIGTDGKKQSIEANRLVLDTADYHGKTLPAHVTAFGSVHAFTDDELRAENLDVILKPSPRAAQPTTRKSDGDNPQVDLQQLLAWGNVVAKSKDGSIAMGDKLTVSPDGLGKQVATLTGASGAKVIDPKGNFVTGPELEFHGAEGRVYVIGAGRLEAVQDSTGTTRPATAQKITVTWATGAQFDGGTNRIDADGDVKADTVDSRGFHDEGRGDHVRVDLQHKPDDAATTQPAAELASAVQPSITPITPSPTTAPADAPMQMNFFKDKEVVAITLDGHALLNSTLPGKDGAVEQQMILEAPRVIMREIDPNGERSRTVTVPSVGQMLVRDHREPGAGKKSESGDLHGAILFTWQRSLVYSEAAMKADMVGAVEIKYKPSAGDLTDAIIKGDHLTAFFDKAPAVPAAAITKPPVVKTAKSDDSHMHLRKISIFGGNNANVSVLHGEDTMTAPQVDFDPPNHMMTGIGTLQNPVVFFNGATGRSVVQQVDWDTLTWSPHMQKAILDYHPHADTSTPKPKAK